MSDAPSEGSTTGTPTEGSQPSEHTPSAPTTLEQPTGTEPEDDLAKSKRQATHWQSEARKANKELNSARAELEALRLSQKSEHEQAVEKARREGLEEATKEWRSKFHDAARRNEARRLMNAAGVTAPDLVEPHLHLDDVEVDENGHVDSDTIEKRLRELGEQYPFLFGTDGQPGNHIHHADLGPKQRIARTRDVNADLRAAMLGRRRS